MSRGVTLVGPLNLFLPPKIAGLRIWLDASQETYSDGAAMGTFKDWSGNGNDLTQGTGARQPLFKTNIFGTMPAVRFDGTDDFVEKTALSADASFTFFVVTKKRSAPGAAVQTLLNFNSANARLYANSAFSTNGFVWNANQAAGTPDLGGTVINPNIVVVRVTSTSLLDTWVNGAGNVSFDPSDAITTVTVRRFGANSSGTEAADWDVAEYIEYDSTLSSANMNTVGDYLGLKYSLPWTYIP